MACAELDVVTRQSGVPRLTKGSGGPRVPSGSLVEPAVAFEPLAMVHSLILRVLRAVPAGAESPVSACRLLPVISSRASALRVPLTDITIQPRKET